MPATIAFIAELGKLFVALSLLRDIAHWNKVASASADSLWRKLLVALQLRDDDGPVGGLFATRRE